MRVGTELRVWIGLLVAAQAVTALAGIVLLDRMTPAIGRILEENVDSVEAVEEMALALALPAGAAGRRARFDRALERAAGNVTEDAEEPEIAALRASAEPALAGDAAAVERVVRALDALGAVNHAAMREADRSALALGDAARWALAFLASFGMGVSAFGILRVRGQLLAPLAELSSVVLAQHAGERHRRCARLSRGELSDVLSALNDVLDREAAARENVRDPRTERLRAALLGLLDREPDPLVVWDPAGRDGGREGAVLAANRAAVGALGGDRLHGGLVDRLRAGEGAEGEALGEGPDAPRLVRWDGR